MKSRKVKGTLSAILSLCMLIPGVSAAFGAVSAATDSGASSSLSSTAAGSLVEEDGFTWDNATVYFLLTDRFRNGDTSNDHSYNRGLNQDGSVADIEDDRATFHGGDFAGITQTIEDGYFEDLGVNALWISAPYEQIHGYVIGDGNSPSFAHYAYHGYYVLDYSQTDANFGTEEEFETLVDTAHEHGLRVIIDIVLNHAGYNSLYDMAEYNYGTVLSGWETNYYNFNNITSSGYHDFIDYDSSASDWSNWWGSSWIRCGCAGYSEGGGDNYTQSLSGLPDFKTESASAVEIPNILKTKWTQEGTLSQKTSELDSYFTETGKTRTVTNYISYWLSDWVRKYGVDGFRCDTAKHVEYASWNTLKQACVEALDEWRKNNPAKAGADWQEDFWMTGEAWDHGVGYDSYYSEGGFDSMINFDTCGAGKLASGTVASTYQSYADSINSKEGFNALSFISSHDELLTRGDTSTMIYNGSAFLLLPGGVQIFYGDESNRQLVSGLSFDGYGGSGHSLRGDMNWDSLDETVLAHWQKVGQFRNKHVSVGAGDNITLSATNGVAFGRTYEKNGVSDKVAAVIGCKANTSVTVDVSAVWDDGNYVINAYDNSSSLVTNGKVTFNSGENCTILMEDADGQPLVSLSGDAQFYGTQQVTVSLVDCDSAKVSVDGGNKFIVKDGDAFTIGSTAYANDTISVTVEAENDKTSTKVVFGFVKLGEEDDAPTTDPNAPATEPAVTVSQTSKLTIQSALGTPYVYAWTGSSTAQLGAWPGTSASAVSGSDDTYEITIPVAADTSFNVVLNDGNGTQSADITGLYDGAVLSIDDSYSSVTTVSGGTRQDSGETEPAEGSVTITIKPYDSSQTYYLYAWDSDKNSVLGAWPGTELTETDSDGNYIYTIENYSEINVIVSNGSGQTGDLTGVEDGATIEITNSGCTTCKLTAAPVVLSSYETLKKEARKILAMTSSDYTAESWANAQSALADAELLIDAGDGASSEDDMQAAVSELTEAQAALVLAPAKLTYAVVGETTVSGVTAAAADVTVTVDGNTYTVSADDVTGEFCVFCTAALKSSSTVRIDAQRNGVSGTYSYAMSNGDIKNTTVPTQPTTAEQPSTSAYKLGDADMNGVISILDVTCIKRSVVGTLTFTPEQSKLADVDGNGIISILDATRVQKYIVGVIDGLE